MNAIEPVGATEIGRLAGVNRATVETWTRRYDDFPEPRWTVGGRPAWSRPEVAAWLAQTGRIERNDATRERNQQRRRAYAHRNPDVAWPLIHAEVMAYEDQRQVLGSAVTAHAVTEDILARWVDPSRPRDKSLQQFVFRYLRDAEGWPAGDPAEGWRQHLASLPERDPVRAQPGPGNLRVGRAACIGLLHIHHAPVAWTTRACGYVGAWHVAALSDSGLVERHPRSPLTLRLTPRGIQVAEVLEQAGFGLDPSREAWQCVQRRVAAIIEPEAE